MGGPVAMAGLVPTAALRADVAGRRPGWASSPVSLAASRASFVQGACSLRAGLSLPSYPGPSPRSGQPVRRRGLLAVRAGDSDPGGDRSDDEADSQRALEERIMSGKYGGGGKLLPTSGEFTRPIRQVAKAAGGPGRLLAKALAEFSRKWDASSRADMPVATGDIREIVGQPVFVPLYTLYRVYGGVFRLSFGPKNFVVVSEPSVAKHILMDNATNYSKGLLSEILDFVMGQGLIPADGAVWKARRKMIVPALHKKYVAKMVDMFGESAEFGTTKLAQAADAKIPMEMENFFSRLALDIIGKAVFNYKFDSLTTDDPVIKAVYTVLRESEYRSVTVVPYWNIPGMKWLVPRQRKCVEALEVINETLNMLVAECKRLVDDEGLEFGEEFLSENDPSILHFLIAAGDEVDSKQLRDDLMTMLIAGHETTAAVLTWTFYLLSTHPEELARVQAEVDGVVGDRRPTLDDIQELKFTTRVINESMRMYPQPPVLLRRALGDDVLGGFRVKAGSDLFISTWNLHRSPSLWQDPDKFDPGRFPVDGPTPNEQTENFRYLPFGGGRRKCVGDQFALFESIIAVAMLVRRFDFSMHPDAPPVGMTTGATIHTSEGLLLQVERRVLPPAGEGEEEEAGTRVPGEEAGGARSVSGCPMHAS